MVRCYLPLPTSQGYEMKKLCPKALSCVKGKAGVSGSTKAINFYPVSGIELGAGTVWLPYFFLVSPPPPRN